MLSNALVDSLAAPNPAGVPRGHVALGGAALFGSPAIVAAGGSVMPDGAWTDLRACRGCGTSVLRALYVQTHPLDKYCIVELMTRKGSFKVSACHRIAVAGQDGFPADARAAAELASGLWIRSACSLLARTDSRS